MLTSIGRLTLLALLASLTLTGCGSVAKLLRPDAGNVTAEPAAVTTMSPPAVVDTPAPPASTDRAAGPDTGPVPAAEEGTSAPGNSPAALAEQLTDEARLEPEDYDPWERFNQRTFAFNRGFDRYVLKPAAKAYDVVMPEPWQAMISRAFENLRWPVRFVNNLLQQKWGGAGRELARFLINTTAGVAGFWDPARDYWHIEASPADFGQTLGKWGTKPGPYLVLPLLPPMTVRDGVGLGVDGATSPMTYFVAPFFWDGFGLKGGDTVNDRAMNIDLYQGFEESVVDMYSAVRNAYLRKREQRIKE